MLSARSPQTPRTAVAVGAGLLASVLVACGSSPVAPPPDQTERQGLSIVVAAGSGLEPPPVETHDARLSTRSLQVVPSPGGLSIPQIGVDVPVTAVGTDAEGQLDVPDDASAVSWYRHGPTPGDPGSAVLAGHVDYAGEQGVFWRLDELRVGQDFEVATADGPLPVRVVSVDHVRKSQLPVAELFRTAGPPQVVLVTCGGPFDRAKKAYRDNVVVVAVPVSDAVGDR